MESNEEEFNEQPLILENLNRIETFGRQIHVPLAEWRAANPTATTCDITLLQGMVTDDDFRHLAGIKALNMSDIRTVTDAAFAHLEGIEILVMSGCRQPGITDAAFAHLRGIIALDMARCNQASITNAAFAHLEGIRELEMNSCDQPGITDEAFIHLTGIRFLSMVNCRQPGITDAAFSNLEGIRYLNVGGCNQPTITPMALVPLYGIRTMIWKNWDENSPLRIALRVRHIDACMSILIEHPEAVTEDPRFVPQWRATFTNSQIMESYRRVSAERAKGRRGTALTAMIARQRARVARQQVAATATASATAPATASATPPVPNVGGTRKKQRRSRRKSN